MGTRFPRAEAVVYGPAELDALELVPESFPHHYVELSPGHGAAHIFEEFCRQKEAHASHRLAHGRCPSASACSSTESHNLAHLLKALRASGPRSIATWLRESRRTVSSLR